TFFVNRSTDYFISFFFFNRNRFPCEHGFIDRGVSIYNRSIDRYFFTWFNKDKILVFQIRYFYIMYIPILIYLMGFTRYEYNDYLKYIEYFNAVKHSAY